jgi:acetoacetyl-CoA synthetase
MADAYLAVIRSVQPSGPYALAGHSLGGLVALEMARRLIALGDEIEWLGMVDSELHHSCLTAGERLRWLARKSRELLKAAAADPRTRLPRYSRKVLLRIAPRAPITAPERESTLPPLMRRLENAGWAACDAYRPAPYSGCATFFRTEDPRMEMGDPVPTWRRVVEGGLTVETVPGTHADVVSEANVRHLAERVSAHLAASASGHRSRHS